MPKPVPLHQWTHDGDCVLIIKCADKEGRTYNGFQWPDSGPVKPATWSREPTCESGGLFGWPWGIGIGEGKEPIWDGRWYVFRASPADVVALQHGKVKAREGEVIFRGTYNDVMQRTIQGRIAYVMHASKGSASTSGDRSSASTSGDQSSASTSGDQSSASTSGDRSSASTSGYLSSASTSGDYSIAAVCGEGGKVACKAGVAVLMGRQGWWTPYPDAILLQWWRDDNHRIHHKQFDPQRLHLKAGHPVYIEDGKIIPEGP